MPFKPPFKSPPEPPAAGLPAPYRLASVHALDPALAPLLAASDAYMAALYPADSNHLDGAALLAAAGAHVLGVWCAGALVGCGAVKPGRDADGAYGELKRLFVVPGHRGRGLSKALVQALEAHLVRSGVAWAKLETGIHQPEALALYRGLGYCEVPPFGPYRADPLSLFMAKALGPD